MLSKDLQDFMDSNINSRAKFKLYSLFVDIAASLRNLRQERGMTQGELARLSNTSNSAIARWEKDGYSGYSLSKLVEIADALSADISLEIVPRERYRALASFTKSNVEWVTDANWANAIRPKGLSVKAPEYFALKG
jgi:transcriptional regulator with XRE-family HTH domain